MEIIESINDRKLKRAKARIEEIKNFYNHIFTYIIVNLFITFVWKFSFTIFDDFKVSNQFDEEGFIHIPIWFIWGIFLALDALKTFGFLNFFGKDWEERKIEEFMKE
ncbi:2TM domain-containing protein [uncultured Polaribacter sp.]|uniref:2TM domain-containing protein n=1 Tax=uncultured Polaribacter sp. TaxID=174711 RepID=UPI0030D91CAE|tara:strand:- start:44688 stop:45008 length:321 start_codon:yes stop_codon:yes gene_type:complete